MTKSSPWKCSFCLTLLVHFTAAVLEPLGSCLIIFFLFFQNRHCGKGFHRKEIYEMHVKCHSVQGEMICSDKEKLVRNIYIKLIKCTCLWWVTIWYIFLLVFNQLSGIGKNSIQQFDHSTFWLARKMLICTSTIILRKKTSQVST